MPRQPVSKPFRIARPVNPDLKILACAYASLGRSNQLLQQGSPSLFLGDQRCELFPLAGEIERTPKVDQTILTDQRVRVGNARRAHSVAKSTRLRGSSSRGGRWLRLQ